MVIVSRKHYVSNLFIGHVPRFPWRNASALVQTRLINNWLPSIWTHFRVIHTGLDAAASRVPKSAVDRYKKISDFRARECLIARCRHGRHALPRADRSVHDRAVQLRRAVYKPSINIWCRFTPRRRPCSGEQRAAGWGSATGASRCLQLGSLETAHYADYRPTVFHYNRHNRKHFTRRTRPVCTSSMHGRFYRGGRGSCPFVSRSFQLHAPSSAEW